MNSITSRFDKAADTYSHRALAQKTIARDLATLGKTIPAPHRIIEHGCGTGLFTEELSTLFPETEIIACDPSQTMLLRARNSLAGSVSFVCSDVESFPADRKADLLTSASALHWCPSLPAAVRAMRLQSADQAHLLLAVMIDGTLGELHTLRRDLFPDLLPQSALPYADTVLSACEAAGYRLLTHEVREYQTYHDDARSLLQSLHEQGITAGPYSRGRRLFNRKELHALMDGYNKRFRTEDGHVTATYKALLLSGIAS